MTCQPILYHTVSGNNITVYLDVVDDTDLINIPFAIDSILTSLVNVWGPIATANGWTMTFALGPNTPVPNPLNLIPPPIFVVNPGLMLPPPGVNVFAITAGRGAGAGQDSKSGGVSYVDYASGNGYIYQPPNGATILQDIAHEMGHILGLVDRYYDAVYWLNDQAINRTCRQIQRGQFVVPEDPSGFDFRVGQPDTSVAGNLLPRLAVRVTLPMSQLMVPAESDFVPMNNLMSTGTPTLTTAQRNVIMNSLCEEPLRQANWVAVLGEWKRYWSGAPTPPVGSYMAGTATPTDFPADSQGDLTFWPYPTWEARPQDGGKGLLFLKPPPGTTVLRYGCVSSRGKGKKDGDILHAARLAMSMGKSRVHAFGGTAFTTTKNPDWKSLHPDWMCHSSQMISDLM